MQPQAKSHSFWLTWTGLLLAAAIISGAVAWWMIAWPVATLSNAASHRGHFPMTFAHMVVGTGMLALGALNLFLGSVRTHAKLHRRVGQAYLLIGAFGATSALVLTLSPAHKPMGAPVFTNATVSLTMLAMAWLTFGALAWRAARNRQFVSHRDWAIRSYVLVWSFVFCRIASRTTDLDQLGGGEAFIWLSWVGPIIICEIALQWSRGAPSHRGSGVV